MKTTILKSTILEADKLATIYAGELRQQGFTPSNCLGVTSDKILRVQFQNGELNEIALPLGKVAAWAKLVSNDRTPAQPRDIVSNDAKISVTFGKLDQGCRKVTLQSGGSEISFLNQADNSIEFARVSNVPPILFDDKHTGCFELQKPAGLENLAANIKAGKAAAQFKKLREAELQAKQNLKFIACEHVKNLATVAVGIAGAIASARSIITWRRLIRWNLKNQTACPAWFNDAARGEHGEHLAIIGNAEKMLAEYKPRQKKNKDWQGRLTGETTPVYGPAYDALTNKVCAAKVALRDFILQTFRAEIALAGLPVVCGQDKMNLHYSPELRQLSRARIAVRNYASKKNSFALAYIETMAARKKAQPKLAAAGGVIKASATLANGGELEAITFSADMMEKQVARANETGATIHILESNHPAYPVGDIMPKGETVAIPAAEIDMEAAKKLSFVQIQNQSGEIIKAADVVAKVVLTVPQVETMPADAPSLPVAESVSVASVETSDAIKSAALAAGEKLKASRAIRLAAVKPICGELPEPSVAFEVVATIEPSVAESIPVQIAPVLVMAIRRDTRGEIINGNFPMRESSGPVKLPPIPPRVGGALAAMIQAGEKLAGLMRGESSRADSFGTCAVY